MIFRKNKWNSPQERISTENYKNLWEKIRMSYQNWYKDFPKNIKSEFDDWISNNDPNKYELFIQSKINNKQILPFWPIDLSEEKTLKKKLFLDQIPREIHHIVPLFEGGSKYDPFNRILLTNHDHVLAHIKHFQCFKKKGDYDALNLRLNTDPKENSRLKSILIAEKNSKNKILFWSKQWQSIQGKKGGIKGGLANTVKQTEARKRVGTCFGKLGGMAKQTHKSQSYLWKDLLLKHDSGKELFIPANSCETFGDIVLLMEKLVPNNFKNKSGIYKLVYK